MDYEITQYITEANDKETKEFIDFLRQFPEAKGLIHLICESE